MSLLSSAISLDSLKAKEQWHSQTQYVGRAELGLQTALLEYMTVLLEYIDLSISVAGHSRFGRPRPALGYATNKET